MLYTLFKKVKNIISPNKSDSDNTPQGFPQGTQIIDETKTEIVPPKEPIKVPEPPKAPKAPVVPVIPKPTKPTKPTKPKDTPMIPETSKPKEPTIQDYLSENTFNSLFPKARNGTYSALVENLPRVGITTPERIGAFLSQCSHESMGFSVGTENLNYSQSALVAVFGKYFGPSPKKNPREYARKPELIANVVYANRMGNGPESSGDGWKYRGRGFIQLTGKNNYVAFQKSGLTDKDIVNKPDTVSRDIDLCVLSALWYWNTNNLNRLADNRDVRGLTKAINGGYNGLDDRQRQYSAIMNSMIA